MPMVVHRMRSDKDNDFGGRLDSCSAAASGERRDAAYIPDKDSMRFNLDTYLISSSPPSNFGVAHLPNGTGSFYRDWRALDHGNAWSSGNPVEPLHLKIHHMNGFPVNMKTGQSWNVYNGFHLNGRGKQDACGPDDIDEYEDLPNGMLRVPPVETSKSRRVKFADDVGKNLTQVRFFAESSDEPPELDPKILDRYVDASNSATSGDLTDTPSSLLIPNFPQPIANYSGFIEKLEENYVSLESIHFPSNLELHGLVKVKNVSFQKSVFVRFSFDGWKSFTDVGAIYRATDTNPGKVASVDTFFFKYTMPSKPDVGRKVEFAVCFRCQETQEFWDNNQGSNYELVYPEWVTTADETPPADQAIFNLHSEINSWAEFIGWSHENVSNSHPYW